MADDDRTTPDDTAAADRAAHERALAEDRSEDLPEELREDDDVDLDDDELVEEYLPAGPGLATRLGAEAVGAFLVVLAALGTAMYTLISQIGTIGMALATGLAFVGVSAAFGHVSGGHANPALTLASAIAGRTRWADVVPYWLAQVVGGVAAGATVFLTVPSTLATAIGQEDARGLFTTVANAWGEDSQLWSLSQQMTAFDARAAFVIELVGGALLATVFLAAGRGARLRGGAPYAVGLTYAALLMVAAPITGAGLNPARSTGAAIFSEPAALGQLWLFWAAPLVGAAVAAVLHRAFASDEEILEEIVVEETVTRTRD